MAVLEEKDVMKMLEETEAVLHGHFLLTSGLHSPMYVEKFNVLQHPKYTERLCQEIARRYENDNVELVVGPMTGGILLAHEVGKALGSLLLHGIGHGAGGGVYRELTGNKHHIAQIQCLTVRADGGRCVGGRYDFHSSSSPLL